MTKDTTPQSAVQRQDDAPQREEATRSEFETLKSAVLELDEQVQKQEKTLAFLLDYAAAVQKTYQDPSQSGRRRITDPFTKPLKQIREFFLYGTANAPEQVVEQRRQLTAPPPTAEVVVVKQAEQGAPNDTGTIVRGNAIISDEPIDM